MPYPRHYLLSWGGDFVSDPTEVWNNNVRLAVDDNVDLASHLSLDASAMSAALTDATAKIKAHMASSDSGYSSNVRLKYVKFNEIETTGLYRNSTDSNTAFQSGTLQTGGSGTSVFPITSAIVVTFLTSAERGPGSRGRVFIPHPAVTLAASTYKIPATRCTAMATQWRAFLSGLSYGTPQDPIVPAVVSDRGAAGVGRTINQTQLGDFLDYMGSRRNRLVETRYTSATFN